MAFLLTFVNLIILPAIGLIAFYKIKKQELRFNRVFLIDYSIVATISFGVSWLLSLVLGMILQSQVGTDSPFYLIVAALSAAVSPVIVEQVQKRNREISVSTLEKIIREVPDVIILAAIACACFYQTLGGTTFLLPLNTGVLWGFLRIIPFVVLFRCFFYYKEKALWLSIPVGLVYYFATPTEHYLYPAFVCFLIVGCVGMNVRKIYYAAFVPTALVTMNMVFGSLNGAIYSMATSGRNIRAYWGNCSPTDAATIVLFCVIFMWLIFKDLPDEFFIIPACFSLFFSFYITTSNTAGYETVLFILILLFMGFEKRLIIKKDKLSWITKTVDWILRGLFPVLGVFMVVVTVCYLYEIPFAKYLDTVLHKRFVYTAAMLGEHGVKPFGTFFNMNGNGWSTIASISQYTFLDCSYTQILIRYGWVTFIAACILWVYATNRAIKAGNRRLAFTMGILAVNFMMEHHYFELFYDPFIFMPFADFAIDGAKELKSVTAFKEKWKDKKFAISFTVTAFVAVVVMFLLLPTLFSALRTIFNGYGWSGGGEGGVVVFITITVIEAVLVAIIWNLSMVAATFVCGDKLRRVNLMTLAILVVISLGGAVGATDMVNNVYNAIADRIVENVEVMSIVCSAKTGKLYVDEFPSAYKIAFDEIDYSYFNGDDFARSKNATVVVKATNDSQCFQARGFLYLQMSDHDAIYTNDEGVISALKENGYVLKGYNDAPVEINLEKMAAMNGLRVTKAERYPILNGPEKQIYRGPLIEINSGKYVATYKLLTNDEASDEDYKICTLKVTSYYESKVLATRAVMRSDFDEEGNVTIDLPFDGYGRDYEFKVYMEPGRKCMLTGLSYAEIPNYDRHVKIDDEGRVIHAEYYDLDGNPLLMSGGYYGIEYAYDRKDNQTMERYLDENMEPVMVSGYCEVRREYNKIRQVTRQSYYGTEGERITLSDGNFMWEKEYDFAGNCTEIRYYGIDEEPILVNDQYWKTQREYNDDNRLVREEFYGTDGEPILISDGYFARELEYDENGNVTVQTFYDARDKKVITSKGYAKLVKAYNANKQVIREEYYDEKDNLIALSNGIAAIENDYDGNKNRIAVRYYDADNEPVLYNGAYWNVRYSYNEKNQVIREEYYGTDGQLILLSDGSCGYDKEYDAAGNVTKCTYLGTDLLPATNKSGYASWRRTYDTNKRVTREEYLDVDGKLIALSKGQAIVEYEYDEAGNRSVVKYYDASEAPLLYENSYWCLRYSYNDKKQVIHEEYYGTDGNLIQLSNGSYGYDRKYDDAGNCNECTYLGADLQPTINTSGYAMWRRVYNDKKQVVREEYFDVNGNPLALSAGQAAVEYEYDENGNRTVERYYDADNSPVLYSGGYWYYRVTYNENNQNILEEYYGTDGEKISRSDGACAYSREYDDAGNVVKLSYLGIDGNPVMNTSGYSFWKRQYSESKQVLREEYYDTSGVPVALPTGEAVVEYKYDDNGNKTEIRYLDIENKLVMRNGEYVYMKLTYNDSNVKVIEALYDAEGNLISKNYTEGYEDYEEVMAQQEEEPESTEQGDYRIYDPNASYTKVNEKVTAISGTVNLRNIPSLDESSVIMYKLKAGETIVRTGIGKNGWSQLSFKGRTIYGVTEFLKVYDESEQEQQDQAGEGQQSGEGQQNQSQSDTTHQNNSQNTQDSASSTQSKSTDPTAYSISWGKDNKNCTVWSSGKLQGTMTVTDADGEAKAMTNYGLYYSGSGKNQKKYLNISVPKGESELSVNTDSGFVECMKIMGYNGVCFNKQVINW